MFLLIFVALFIGFYLGQRADDREASSYKWAVLATLVYTVALVPLFFKYGVIAAA